jgi:aryl-alcohol dehydrogenase-like predicted oxidoreductase
MKRARRYTPVNIIIPMEMNIMQYRSLGKTKLKVSEIGFGAWAIGGSWGPQNEQESVAALHKALDLGVTFIDTAAGYGDGKSERIIAEVLKTRQENVIVATKTPPLPGDWPPGPYNDMDARYPEKYLRENVEQRLRNLQTDCLDVLQLHTWTRAWNRNPRPFEVLRKLQAEGKIRAIGVSTPEHDQNSVIDLMRGGWVDTVQVIYNLFEQEPAAELLPAAKETGVGIIVRVVFDEGALTGKFTPATQFAPDDFRRNYFAGDRLERVIRRAERIQADIAETGLTLAQVALKFALMHSAVSTVIPGIRNVSQAEANTSVSDLAPLSEALMDKLHQHNWQRGFWYGGK